MHTDITRIAAVNPQRRGFATEIALSMALDSEQNWYRPNATWRPMLTTADSDVTVMGNLIVSGNLSVFGEINVGGEVNKEEIASRNVDTSQYDDSHPMYAEFPDDYHDLVDENRELLVENQELLRQIADMKGLQV